MSQPLIAAAVIIAMQSRWALHVEVVLSGGLGTVLQRLKIVAARVLVSPPNPWVQITELLVWKVH